MLDCKMKGVMPNKSPKAKHGLGAAALDNDDIVINDTGLCVLCGEKTACKCDRCGDFYCSEFCQRKDWQQHRYICFPMPKLVKIGVCTNSKTNTVVEMPQSKDVSKTPTISANTNMPTNGSCVILTGFKTTNRCYIRSTNPSVVAEYQKVLNEIHDFGKTSSPLSKNPKTNSYALALRKDKWCRIQILGNRNGSTYRIFFVDFGCIVTEYLKNMRKITPSLESLPCFIYMVQLHGVTKYFIETEILRKLDQYTNKEYKVEFVSKDNVKLFEWGSSILVNTLIVGEINKFDTSEKNIRPVSATSLLQNGNGIQQNVMEKSKFITESSNKKDCNNQISTIEKNDVKNEIDQVSDSLSVTSSTNKRTPAATPRQIQKPCLQPPFETISLNENDGNSKIFIVDDSFTEIGFIGCILEQNMDNLNAVTKFLSEYKVSDQSYKPKFNEYCLAEYDKEWYRAKVVEILSEDLFLVVYIDFTNEKEITSKSIRRYPMSLTLPCCTNLCGIDGLPDEMSDELKHFLQSNFKAFTHFNIDGVRIVENIAYIVSKELLNKLRELKLL